jgi:transcriptional regulator GlxA family with amidase domain
MRKSLTRCFQPGLVIMPDRRDGPRAADRTIAPASGRAPMIDLVLASVARDYGRSMAFGVAPDFEYPGFHE